MTRYTPLWLQAGSYPASVDRRLLNALWPGAATTGLAVTAVSGTMSVNISPGKAAIPVSTGAGTALCTSDAVEPVTLAAAPGSGLRRWDLIICQVRGNDLDGGANNDFIFTSVTGTPAAAGSEVVPPLPPNALNVAVYHVFGGSASIDPANLVDQRPGGLSLPSPIAGGDLGGTLPNPTVIGLQGRPMASTPPGSGQALVWNGSTWTPSNIVTGSIVNQLVAGPGISLAPPGGTGVVTVSSTGGSLGNGQSFITSNVSLPNSSLTTIASVALTGTSRTWQITVTLSVVTAAAGVNLDFGVYQQGVGWIGATTDYLEVIGAIYAMTYSVLWNSGANSSYTLSLMAYSAGAASSARAVSASTSVPNSTGIVAEALN